MCVGVGLFFLFSRGVCSGFAVGWSHDIDRGGGGRNNAQAELSMMEGVEGSFLSVCPVHEKLSLVDGRKFRISRIPKFCAAYLLPCGLWTISSLPQSVAALGFDISGRRLLGGRGLQVVL